MLEPHRLALSVGERAANDERLDDGDSHGSSSRGRSPRTRRSGSTSVHSRRRSGDGEEPAGERGVDPGGGQRKRQVERDQRPEVRRQPSRAKVPRRDDRAEDRPKQRDAGVDLDPTAPAEAVFRRESDTHRGLDLIEREPGGEQEEGGAEASLQTALTAAVSSYFLPNYHPVTEAAAACRIAPVAESTTILDPERSVSDEGKPIGVLCNRTA